MTALSRALPSRNSDCRNVRPPEISWTRSASSRNVGRAIEPLSRCTSTRSPSTLRSVVRALCTRGRP
jgi:hypothetical protein